MKILKYFQKEVYSSTVKIVSLPDVSDPNHSIKPKFDHDSLHEALDEVENFPVMVVSISGEFRSGKSFFLNLMTTYLDCLQQVSFAKHQK